MNLITDGCNGDVVCGTVPVTGVTCHVRRELPNFVGRLIFDAATQTQAFTLYYVLR